MNSLFRKIIARTVLQVLWENQGTMEGPALWETVTGRLGRSNTRKTRYSHTDVADTVEQLVEQKRIDVVYHTQPIRDFNYEPGSYRLLHHTYSLPVLDRIAALSPEA